MTVRHGGEQERGGGVGGWRPPPESTGCRCSIGISACSHSIQQHYPCDGHGAPGADYPYQTEAARGGGGGVDKREREQEQQASIQASEQASKAEQEKVE